MQENSSSIDIASINEKIERESAFVDILSAEMKKVIVGQKHMVERLLIGSFRPGSHSSGRGAGAGKNPRD